MFDKSKVCQTSPLVAALVAMDEPPLLNEPFAQVGAWRSRLYLVWFAVSLDVDVQSCGALG